MIRHLLSGASVCNYLCLTIGFILSSAVAVLAEDAPGKRPNFVVILADDMGYSDLGCYGGEIRTPHLDSLARDGIRFTQFYNTARCCPTRASLLTGLYPHQAGIGHMMDDRGLPGYQGNLNDQCRTIAEMLQPAGYANYAVGKWHVTRHAGAEGPKNNWPIHRGFDRFYGTIHGAGSFFDPSSLVRDNTMISPFADEEYQPETYYYTDAISDHAIRYIREHTEEKQDKPFFLYVAYTAAHWPMHALPEDIQKYRGVYDEGYDAIRKKRLQKGSQIGVMNAEQGLAPTAKDWASVQHRDWEIACMEVYAAMVDRMDQGIGRIRAELEAQGLLDDTVIFYLQDNGGCAEGMGRVGNPKHPNIARPASPTLSPMKPTDFAAAGSVPDQTRDGYPVRMGPKAMPGPADTYVAYGEGWANVSNTPFREYKHWVHEGGISTPLIAFWPKGIKKAGSLANDPGHLIDIAATLVDLSGAKYPSESTPLEGLSLRPVFDGNRLEREAIYWEHEGNRAVRSGKWKLVAKHGKPWELYDIDADRIEAHDLAAEQPAKVAELRALYETYAKRANVAPWPLKSAK
ncbi:arylsulfatase [Pirellula sp. SH-Sr6A]|uniref:arylsulfatase n=1 Tax=Pirellula sp. SH-Sr6A TaxID=1632865 RepID=UPI0011BACF7A|nr:arylsulfatase [Pirellula sp. SH-Sr6A]